MTIKLEFLNYPRKVEIAKARRVKYYTPTKPAKATKYNDRSKYQYLKKIGDKELFLYEIETDTKVIANPKAAGTPSYEIINAQKLYNQHMTSFTRAKIVNFLHEYFKFELSNKEQICRDIKNLSEKSPLRMSLEIHDTIKVDDNSYWDAGNRGWLYVKAFEDTLTELGIIKDDNTLFIPRPCAYLHIPIHKELERKLVITIEAETDVRIVNNEEYMTLRKEYVRKEVKKRVKKVKVKVSKKK
jgi:hypothetical protein